MGWFSFLSSEEREKNRVATAIALETGLIEECPVCRNLFDRQHANRLDDTDRAITRAFADGEQRLAVFSGDPEALRARVRKIRDALPYACQCESDG